MSSACSGGAVVLCIYCVSVDGVGGVGGVLCVAVGNIEQLWYSIAGGVTIACIAATTVAAANTTSTTAAVV